MFEGVNGGLSVLRSCSGMDVPIYYLISYLSPNCCAAALCSLRSRYAESHLEVLTLATEIEICLFVFFRQDLIAQVL